MVPKARFFPHLSIWFRLSLLLIFTLTIAVSVHGQSALYHLHAENSAGIYQLKTAGPDAASSALKSINLKNVANGDYVIAEFATLSGVPNASGMIPAGSGVSVSVWLRKSSTQGAMYPRAKLYLNSANGPLVAVLTGSTALTTTLTKYTFGMTVSSNIPMSATDRFHLWVGVTVTAKSGQNNQAEVNIEGTLNGNYDSTLSVPLPVPPPTISGLSPDVGGVGTAVTVAGNAFGATQGTSTVTFNGISATPISWSNTSIVVPVPAGASSGPLVVRVNGQNSNGVTFTVSPKIDSLTPSSGVVGAAVTISGSSFGATQGSSTVTFNGTVATPTNWSSTNITTVVPAGSTTGPVIVTAGGQASNGVTFTVTAAGAISGTITATSDGAAIGGASVKALQGGVVKASSTSAANGSYTIANVQVGTYDVRVEASGYQEQTQNDVVVTVNTTTTVNHSLEAVVLGAIKYIYDEMGRLVAIITPTEAATYTYDAVGNLLSISRGNSSQVSVIEFTPNGGPIGATVTIYGTAFSTTPSENTVTFNGVAANVTSATATQIVTQVPAGATTGPIVVTTPIGAATSNTPFVVADSGPTITGFTPTIGSHGMAVTITGTNFDPKFYNNKVEFNGVLSPVTSATDTTITTTVPAGASSGRITVHTPAGTATSSNDFEFVSVPPPYATWPPVEVVGRMAIGQSKVVTITVAPKIALIVFDGVAGQWVSLGMSDATIGATQCCSTSSVSIYAANGTTLLAPFAFYRAGGGTPSVKLPTTGTYTIVVAPYPFGTMAGSVTLTLSEDLSPPISINGPPVTMTNRIGQNERLFFSGNAGQWISLGVGDTTIAAPGWCCETSTVAIYKPDGTALLTPLEFYQPGINTQSLQLPVTGTYMIVVDPYQTVAGDVTLTLSEDLSPPISINGPPVVLQFNRTGQNSRLPFSGTAGQWVSVGMTDSTISASACCTTSTVAIYKPDGTTLLAPFSFYQVGGGTPSVQLPTTGTYSIVVEPLNNGFGNVTITLSEDLSPPISINGAPVTLTNRAGQNARLFFSGSAGQWVSLATSDSTIGAPACCTTSTMAILKPDGTTLQAPLGFYSSSPVTTTPSLQLPVTGTYSILVDPYNAVAGNVTLTLSEDLSPPISINGPPVVLQFQRVGQNARLPFSGTAGQWVSVGMSDTTISAPGCCTTSTVAILKPDGTELLAPFGFFQVGGGTLSVQLPTTGTYSIVVKPFNNLVGQVTITLSEDLSPPISINGPPVTLTNRPGQNARLFFSGTTGQWVSLAISDANIGAPGCCTTSTVAILKPDGTTLQAPLGFFQSNPVTATPSLKLPVTGTYSILVDPYHAVAGNVTLTLSEDLSPPISINGPPVVLQFQRVGQNARLPFSGTAGQWVSVGTSDSTISAQFCCTSSTVAIYKPDGTELLAPFAFFQAGGGTPSVQLPTTGTYLIAVKPFNNLLGNVTLTLSEDLSPPISINGPPVTLTNRIGQNARLLFSGSAGQWVSLGMSDTTIGAQFCCTTSTVAILKPDGATLLAPFGFFQAGGGTPSVQLPTTGTYSIVVDPINGVAGNVTVTLSEDLSPPISINGPSVILTNRPGQNARLFFSGTAGQWVGLGMGDTTIGAQFCCTTSTVAIFKPDGTTLQAPLGFFQGGAGTPSLQLPTTGTYTIVVDPYNAVAGNVTLTLSEDLSPPMSINGPPVTLTNRAGQNARLLFSGNAGQWVSLAVTDSTISAPFCCTTSTVAIYKPDGTALLAPLGFLQSSPVTTTQSLQLPVSGTYLLVLDPYNAVAGNVTLTLSEDLSPPISINGGPVSLNFNRVGQNASLSVSGTAGQQVTVRVTGNAIGSVTVRLLRPDGTELTSAGSSSSSFNLATQTLPTTGTYRIIVDPSVGNTGSLNISVTNP